MLSKDIETLLKKSTTSEFKLPLSQAVTMEKLAEVENKYGELLTMYFDGDYYYLHHSDAGNILHRVIIPMFTNGIGFETLVVTVYEIMLITTMIVDHRYQLSIRRY